MAQRVSQEATLALAEGSPKARVSQEATLALGEGSPKSRVSQVAVLVLIDATAQIGFPGGSLYEMVLP